MKRSNVKSVPNQDSFFTNKPIGPQGPGSTNCEFKLEEYSIPEGTPAPPSGSTDKDSKPPSTLNKK